MIKKILGFLLFGLLIVNFVNAQSVGETSVQWEILVGGQNTYNGITTEFKQNGNLQYSVFENIKVLNFQYNTSCPFHSSTFWHNGMLYGIINSTCSTPSSGIPRYWWQGYLPLCLTQGTGDKDFCMSNFSFDYYNNPNYYNPDSLQSYSFNSPHVFCFVYYDRGEKLCWYLNRQNSFTGGNLFDSGVFSNTDERLVTIPQSSPWGGGGGIVDDIPKNGFNGSIEITDSDIINYFESQGFSENLCFVGTWDLSSNNYDDFKFSKNGNGEHIFNFFRYAYNIGTGEEYKLHYVGNFLNELYQNNYTFKEILHSSGDLIDIFEFNYPTNNYVSWYSALYNDSLYPYLNKPLVYQLYPHQLYYYLPDWDINDRKYDLVEYCYFKLGFNQHRNISGNNQDNYGNAGNLQFSGDDALIQNVSDYLAHLSIYDSRIMTGNFWGSGGSSVNIALDFNGSPIDYFVEQNSSGSYENFDTLTFLNESFNRFKGVFGDLNPSDFGFGYLPGYIITFMLAFILFRFLSH